MITWKEIEAPMAKSSIRIVLSQLCAVLSHALEEGVIETNLQ